MQQIANELRSIAVDRDRAFIAEDIAILRSHKDRTEKLRIQRGQLSDQRFVAASSKEVWQ